MRCYSRGERFVDGEHMELVKETARGYEVKVETVRDLQRPLFALRCELPHDLRNSRAVIGISLAQMRDRSFDDLVPADSR